MLQGAIGKKGKIFFRLCSQSKTDQLSFKNIFLSDYRKYCLKNREKCYVGHPVYAKIPSGREFPAMLSEDRDSVWSVNASSDFTHGPLKRPPTPRFSFASRSLRVYSSSTA